MGRDVPHTRVVGDPGVKGVLRREWAAECLGAVPARTEADGAVGVTVAVPAVVAVAVAVEAAAADRLPTNARLPRGPRDQTRAPVTAPLHTRRATPALPG
jgi:hypothetical protein